MAGKKIRKKAVRKKPKPVKTGKRLTPTEWGQLEEMWASGDFTLKDLAEAFGANASYLSTALAKRGIEKGSKAEVYAEAAKDEVEKEMISDAATNIKRIKDSKEEHYKYASSIAKLIFSVIARAISDKTPLSDIKDDVATLKLAMSGIQMARADRWAITGLDREPDAGDEIPVLPIEEFTQSELNEIERLGDPNLVIPDSLKSIDQLADEIEGAQN
jgi:hypothetical protein